MWQKSSAANYKLYPKRKSVAKTMYNNSFKPTTKGTNIPMGLFQKHGLQEASLYKSFTMDKSQVVDLAAAPELDRLVKQLLALHSL